MGCDAKNEERRIGEKISIHAPIVGCDMRV